MSALSGSVRALARKSKGVFQRFPRLRRLYYSLFNADSFSDLFWHDLMLADRVRMETYAQAIDSLIEPGHVVVDVGTGTGVLACLAAQRGARVHAVEHGPLIERARELAARNGLDNIVFHNAHSKDFDPGEKVDVILHEQIGMNLLDEDMVENVSDLRDRVLRPNGKILPGVFDLYVDPVQLRDDRTIPYLWEQRFHGLDFSCLAPTLKPWARGQGYDKRALEPDDVVKNFAPRTSVLRLDLHRRETSVIPPAIGSDVLVEKDGRVDGFALYFRAAFDDNIQFVTGPGDRRTHWACRLLRTEALEVRTGARLRFAMSIPNVTNADTWTWTYSVDH